MKMKKTDIGVVAFMYIVCGFFFYHAVKLPDDSKTYPYFTIALLFGLTTLYLVQMLVAAKKHGVESGVDEVFKDFQPLQFLVCLGAVILYMVLMYIFGFYISTVVFMAGVLFFLKVKPIPAIISIAALNLLVYVAFHLFLGVKLPMGLIFS